MVVLKGSFFMALKALGVCANLSALLQTSCHERRQNCPSTAFRGEKSMVKIDGSISHRCPGRTTDNTLFTGLPRGRVVGRSPTKLMASPPILVLQVTGIP